MDEETLQRIPGAAELARWFGHFPSFHDGALTEMTFTVEGNGVLKFKAFGFTQQVDKNGTHVLDRHFTCNMTLEGVRSVSLSEFLPGWAIICSVEILCIADAFEIDITSSYGVSGKISAEKVCISFEPAAPGGDKTAV